MKAFPLREERTAALRGAENNGLLFKKYAEEKLDKMLAWFGRDIR